MISKQHDHRFADLLQEDVPDRLLLLPGQTVRAEYQESIVRYLVVQAGCRVDAQAGANRISRHGMPAIVRRSRRQGLRV